jgi:hypothetical protein
MGKKRSFHGDLGLLSTVNLFQMIGLAGLSGQLVVRGPEKTAYFIFTKGKLNYGFTMEGRKKFGQILLDSQLITADQLEVCLADQKKLEKWKKLGSIVVDNGFLQHSQLTDLFHLQIKDVLFETLTWTEGTFTFVDTSPLTSGDIVLEANVDSLILQGMVFFDDVSFEAPGKKKD